MRHFSTTALPVSYEGSLTAESPALVEIDDDLWMLLAPFSYTKDDGTTYTAPAGMTTDLASIPKPLWNVMPPFGRYIGAAVIHDFLYQTQPCTKEEADHVLAEAMDCAGVDHKTRMLIYDGVKFGGQASWDHHTAEIIGSRSA